MDGLRFVAAFAVLVHHAGFSSGLTLRTDVPGMFLGRLDIGVSIFFVLSGFLLFRPFVVSQFADASSPSSQRFWLRRLVRIFPAYWCALFVLLALGTIEITGAAELLLTITLTQVYSPTHALSGLTQSWSLATEFGFYLLVPAFAAAARRFGTGTRARPRTISRQALWLLGMCIALAAFSVAFRLVMAKLSPYPDGSWGLISRQWTPSYLDIFAIGMALAVVSAWGHHRQSIRDGAAAWSRRVWLWWTIAAGLFWFVSTQFALERRLAVVGVEREIVRQTLYGLVAFAIVTPVVFHAGRARGIRVLSWRPVAWLGIVSYGIYLWHQGALIWAHEWFGWVEFTGNVWVLIGTALVVSTAIAAVSHRYLEEPLSRLSQGRPAFDRPVRRRSSDES